ncbi:MAG: hypothetical protein KBD24_00205 [Candidatus Pacebacteria bacterium]|nr:hypothetical protein [Candidatus Paceibacterota bacterium]
MFNDQAIQDLHNQIAELKDALKLSEERRNDQYTDIMLALRELKDLATTDEEEDGDSDDLYEEAREFVIKEQKASTSLLQRRFKFGYGRAARVMDELEENGVIEASDGTNMPRKVLETMLPEGYVSANTTTEDGESELDEFYVDVEAVVREQGKASTSLIQRHFKVGYGRAARLIDQLEEQGVIAQSDGTSATRKVLEKDEVTSERKKILLQVAKHFKAPAQVIEIKHTRNLTRYCLEFGNSALTKKVIKLKTNFELALALSPISIDYVPTNDFRLYFTLPREVGKEHPDYTFAEVVADEVYCKAQGSLVIPIGVGFDGLVTADLAQVGSILMAGSTGGGKSTFFHSTLISLMQRYTPEQFRALCIDPKRVELTLYDGAPHLYGDHAITSASEALEALQDILQEISRRTLAPAHAGDARVLIAIDELSDLMMSYPSDMEAVLVQIAQTGPSVGVYLIAGTSRPSPVVLTGLLRSAIPARIGFKVASVADSRTIIDQSGAEFLLGGGDGKYIDKGMAQPIRIQAPYIRIQEVKDALGHD